MSQLVVMMDEIHIQVYVPKALAAPEVDRVVELLNSKRFLLQVVRAVRQLFRGRVSPRVRIVLAR